MTDVKKFINELTFQLNSKDVKEEHSAIQLSVSDAEKLLALLKEQDETELCDRCGRRRIKSSRTTDWW